MRASPVPRLPTVVLAFILTAAAGTILAAAWAARGDASSHRTVRSVPLTDRRIKADLLAGLDAAPQTLIFGGSRATRFEPSYLQGLTGMSGFNLALQNGRPEDAWAFTTYARRLFPGLRPRVLWFIHVESFRRQPLSPGLTEDPRLSQAFPAPLLTEARATPYPVDAEARASDLAQTTFDPDGVTTRNRYDIRAETGYPLVKGLAYSTGKLEEHYRHPTPTLDPRAKVYLEKTLRLVDDLGHTPVVVLMPTQPEVLAAIRTEGWQRQHDETVSYLTGLESSIPFTLIDLSEISSVPGASEDAFYDGIHVRQWNARRILDEVVRQAGRDLR
jgi:hypothetical protein